MAATLLRHAPDARVAVEQAVGPDGSAVPRQWGVGGSLAPGDVTFTPLGGATIFFDIVISVGTHRPAQSPPVSAYHQKMKTRYTFLHPRHQLSSQEARARAPMANIDYVPIAFGTLGAAAPKSIDVLTRCLGWPATKQFLIAAARIIHEQQTQVISRGVFAHRTSSASPSQPPTSATAAASSSMPMPPIGRAAGYHASRYFVPVIHAAQIADRTTPSPPPSPELTRVIESARASYTTWAGRQAGDVPPWQDIISRIHKPLLGWPDLRFYFGADEQERILGLHSNGHLGEDLWYLQAWITGLPRIDGWNEFTRSTSQHSRRPAPRRPFRPAGTADTAGPHVAPITGADGSAGQAQAASNRAPSDAAAPLPSGEGTQDDEVVECVSDACPSSASFVSSAPPTPRSSSSSASDGLPDHIRQLLNV